MLIENTILGLAVIFIMRVPNTLAITALQDEPYLYGKNTKVSDDWFALNLRLRMTDAPKRIEIQKLSSKSMFLINPDRDSIEILRGNFFGLRLPI
ncbi:hypothetical protein CBP51_03305 [Cellvibrio mixtus]|uniref:Uncharacterized protein n=2 Tax=Cellvibrio mixtus TaxID=39650 RepID=A0A266Q8A3_9GAMM|nr:hypothetical protein CBP51_03305 [Cellvibrio mixtus]